MTNATATIDGNLCIITLPANPISIEFVPTTSGAAQYTNYCKWSNSTTPLGEWSAHLSDLLIVSNPHNLINTSSKHGTMNATSNPAIQAGNMALVYTHKMTPTSPIANDALKLTVVNQSNSVTIMTVLAEDGNDHNFLDFQMTIIIHS